MLEELDKLEKYLKEKKIPYERYDDPGITNEEGRQIFDRHQIIVPNAERHEWDAICHYGSYGVEKGLLEVMGEKVIRNTSDFVEGYLTADEIIRRLEEQG